MKDNKKNVCLFNFSKVEINSELQLGPSIIHSFSSCLLHKWESVHIKQTNLLY